MKAFLALVAIYVATFVVAIQGASENPVQASAPGVAVQSPARAVDAAKEADIHTLMDFAGVQDQLRDNVANSAEQYRERLSASVPANDKGRAFVEAFVANYQKRFDQDLVSQQVAGIYDRHYSREEVKALLQFYNSPVGQKVIAETPKIAREVAAANQEIASQAAREALQAMKSRNSEVGLSARLAPEQRLTGGSR